MPLLHIADYIISSTSRKTSILVAPQLFSPLFSNLTDTQRIFHLLSPIIGTNDNFFSHFGNVQLTGSSDWEFIEPSNLLWLLLITATSNLLFFFACSYQLCRKPPTSTTFTNAKEKPIVKLPFTVFLLTLEVNGVFRWNRWAFQGTVEINARGNAWNV